MNNIPLKKAYIDKEFMAMTIGFAVMAIFTPNILIHPLITLAIYIIGIYSYLFLGCYVENFGKGEIKKHIALNSITIAICCIAILIMKLWVLADM